MMDGYYHQAYGGDVWGFLIMILMMALFVLGIVVFVRYISQDKRSGHDGSAALDVLRNRYANGEIDTKEFEEKQKALSE